MEVPITKNTDETDSGGAGSQIGGTVGPPSPLTGCYLLVVIGEPHSEPDKEIILQRLTKGFLSWDVGNCHVDLEEELNALTAQAPEGEEARHGERLIQYATENLVTEILIHPQVNTLIQCIRNLLSSFTRHRHLVHAGYTFSGNGSWMLQDGTFSLADFTEAFQEPDVQRVLRAYPDTVTVDLHCAPIGGWATLPDKPFTKGCKLRLNPTDVLESGSEKINAFINYLAPMLVPADLEALLESSDVVGNIRFSHPTLYVFPGGQGDAALFGINGFNMLVDGGFGRKACFWDFARHLDRLDAVLMTRLNNSNVSGLSAVVCRKKSAQVYPQIGHFFCNLQDRKGLPSPDGDKDKDPLLVDLLEEGHDMITNLRALNLKPQACYRDSEPINLYHKVGHGTLDMYVLSPSKDAKEIKEFLQKWNNNDPKLFQKKESKEFTFPIQNLVSVCALLVWQPANPADTITRILFPGSTPESKIFEGLDKIKHLEFMKHPVCSAKTLTPSGSIVALAKHKLKTSPAMIDKIMSDPQLPRQKMMEKEKDNKILDNKIKSALADKSKSEDKTDENKQLEESKPSEQKIEVRAAKVAPISAAPQVKTKPIKEKKVEPKKTENIKASETVDIKIEDALKKDNKIESEKSKKTDNKDDVDAKPPKPKSKPEHKSKIDSKSTTAKPRSDSKPAKSTDRKTAKTITEKKTESIRSTPTTPKKTPAVNGVAKDKELARVKLVSKTATKPSPSNTPAKSTKEANNRKVFESKYKSPAAKKEPVKAAEKKEPVKVERKPISRRPKGTSPSRIGKTPGSPIKSAKSTPTASVKSDKDGVIKKVKHDKEGTTDSSTVSTPSADPETATLKKIVEVTQATPTKEDLDEAKLQELEDLQEEQEVVREIEAVFNRENGVEDKVESDAEVSKVADDSKQESTAEGEEDDEYLIIEKEEVEQFTEDSINEQESVTKEEEIQKHQRDSEESEKKRKESLEAVTSEEAEQKETEPVIDPEEKPEQIICDKVTVDDEMDKDSLADGDQEQAEESAVETDILEKDIDELQDVEVESKEEKVTLENLGDLSRKSSKVESLLSPEHKEQLQEEVQEIICSATEIAKTKTEIKEDVQQKAEEVSKEVSTTSPEEKQDASSGKKTDTREDLDIEGDQDMAKEAAEQNLQESHPDEKFSTTIESGATTAPTLPEDERIPLDEIKEDQIIEEKYVKEETKENEIVTSVLPTRFEPLQGSGVGGMQFDHHQSHLRDIVKTPDEVADLPVHEEADYHGYDDFPGACKKDDKVTKKKDDVKVEEKVSKSKDIEDEKDKDDMEVDKDRKPVILEKETPEKHVIETTAKDDEKPELPINVVDEGDKITLERKEELNEEQIYDKAIPKEATIELEDESDDKVIDIKHEEKTDDNKLVSADLSKDDNQDELADEIKEEVEKVSEATKEVIKAESVIETVVDAKEVKPITASVPTDILTEELITKEKENVEEKEKADDYDQEDDFSTESVKPDIKMLESKDKIDQKEQIVEEEEVTSKLAQVPDMRTPLDEIHISPKIESEIESKHQDSIFESVVKDMEKVGDIIVEAFDHATKDISEVTEEILGKVNDKSPKNEEEEKLTVTSEIKVAEKMTEVLPDMKTPPDLEAEYIKDKALTGLDQKMEKHEIKEDKEEKTIFGSILGNIETIGEKILEAVEDTTQNVIETTSDILDKVGDSLSKPEEQKKEDTRTLEEVQKDLGIQIEQELDEIKSSIEEPVALAKKTVELTTEQGLDEISSLKSDVTNIIKEETCEIQTKVEDKLTKAENVVQDLKDNIQSVEERADKTQDQIVQDVKEVCEIQTKLDDIKKEISEVSDDKLTKAEVVQDLKENIQSVKDSADKIQEEIVHDIQETVEDAKHKAQFDVEKIVTGVANVLKSEESLEEMAEKYDYVQNQPSLDFAPYEIKSYTTELRETHITTLDSPIRDDMTIHEVPEEAIGAEDEGEAEVCPKKYSMSFLNEERKLASIDKDDIPEKPQATDGAKDSSPTNISELIKDSNALLESSSKIISDIKTSKIDCKDVIEEDSSSEQSVKRSEEEVFKIVANVAEVLKSDKLLEEIIPDVDRKFASSPFESLSRDKTPEPTEIISREKSPEPTAIKAEITQVKESISREKTPEPIESISREKTPQPTAIQDEITELKESISREKTPEPIESVSREKSPEPKAIKTEFTELKESISREKTPEPIESISREKTPEPTAIKGEITELKESISREKTPEPIESISREKSPEPTAIKAEFTELKESISREKTPEPIESISREKTPEPKEATFTEKTPEPAPAVHESKEAKELTPTEKTPALSREASPEPKEEITKDGIAVDKTSELPTTIATTPEPTGSAIRHQIPEPKEVISEERTSDIVSSEGIGKEQSTEPKESISRDKTPEPSQPIPAERNVEPKESISREKTPEPVDLKETISEQRIDTPEMKESLSKEQTPERRQSISEEGTHEPKETISRDKTPEPICASSEKEEKPSVEKISEEKESISKDSNITKEDAVRKPSPEPEGSISGKSSPKSKVTDVSDAEISIDVDGKTVQRMLVTASSEDGGTETDICPRGSITFIQGDASLTTDATDINEIQVIDDNISTDIVSSLKSTPVQSGKASPEQILQSEIDLSKIEKSSTNEETSKIDEAVKATEKRSDDKPKSEESTPKLLSGKTTPDKCDESSNVEREVLSDIKSGKTTPDTLDQCSIQSQTIVTITETEAPNDKVSSTSAAERDDEKIDETSSKTSPTQLTAEHLSGKSTPDARSGKTTPDIQITQDYDEEDIESAEQQNFNIKDDVRSGRSTPEIKVSEDGIEKPLENDEYVLHSTVVEEELKDSKSGKSSPESKSVVISEKDSLQDSSESVNTAIDKDLSKDSLGSGKSTPDKPTEEQNIVEHKKENKISDIKETIAAVTKEIIEQGFIDNEPHVKEERVQQGIRDADPIYVIDTLKDSANLVEISESSKFMDVVKTDGTTKILPENLHLSGKSTPDIVDIDNLKEVKEYLSQEKQFSGRSTPPTVPVSPITKEVTSLQDNTVELKSEKVITELRKESFNGEVTKIHEDRLSGISTPDIPAQSGKSSPGLASPGQGSSENITKSATSSLEQVSTTGIATPELSSSPKPTSPFPKGIGSIKMDEAKTSSGMTTPDLSGKLSGKSTPDISETITRTECDIKTNGDVNEFETVTTITSTVTETVDVDGKKGIVTTTTTVTENVVDENTRQPSLTNDVPDIASGKDKILSDLKDSGKSTPDIKALSGHATPDITTLDADKIQSGKSSPSPSEAESIITKTEAVVTSTKTTAIDDIYIAPEAVKSVSTEIVDSVTRKEQKEEIKEVDTAVESKVIKKELPGEITTVVTTIKTTELRSSTPASEDNDLGDVSSPRSDISSGQASRVAANIWGAESSEERHFSDEEALSSPNFSATQVGQSSSKFRYEETENTKNSKIESHDDIPPHYGSEEVRGISSIITHKEDPMSTSFYGALPDSFGKPDTKKSGSSEPIPIATSHKTESFTSYPTGPTESSFEEYTKGDHRFLEEADLDFEKALEEHRQTRGSDLMSSITSKYEFSPTKYSNGQSELKEFTNGKDSDFQAQKTVSSKINGSDNITIVTASSKMTDSPSKGESITTTTSTTTASSSSASTSQPTDAKKDYDKLAEWEKPLGLPSPAPPAPAPPTINENNMKTTPKKERKNIISKVKLNNEKNLNKDTRRRSESPQKGGKKITPVYVDLTYVPHHGNSYYCHVDFFKRVRARYYVFSGTEPSKEVYNALLEAKQTWEDKDLEVTIIPTYDTDVLGYWVSENEDLLAKHRIDLSPSASRCTINLQDHETSCSAYRLEF